MQNTSIALNEHEAHQLATRRDEGGKPTPPWTFDAMAGAGAYRSTIEDMACFLQAAAERTPMPTFEWSEMWAPQKAASGESAAFGWHLAVAARWSMSLACTGSTQPAHVVLTVTCRRRSRLHDIALGGVLAGASTTTWCTAPSSRSGIVASCRRRPSIMTVVSVRVESAGRSCTSISYSAAPTR